MRLYGLALLVHVLGVIAMFAGFSLQQRAGSRLRRAATNADARAWVEVLEATRVMPPSGAVMVLVTGTYLGGRFSAPIVPTWILAAVLAALIIGTLGLTIVSRDLRAIAESVRASVAAGEESLSLATTARIARARTWSAVSAANGAGLGALWLMAMKPGPLEAVLAVLLPVGVGALAGARVSRRDLATRGPEDRPAA